MSTHTISLPDALEHHALASASEHGLTLEQFAVNAVAEKVAARHTQTYIQRRAARGSREKFDQFMAKAPDVEPDESDRLSPENKAVRPTL